MRDALSGVDGTQALAPLAAFPDALSGVVRRFEPAVVQEKAERERREAERRVIEREPAPRRPARGREVGAEAARLTASVPDAYGPTTRSSVVPQQNLVNQGSSR